MPRERLECGWCGEEVLASQCQVTHFKNDYGTTIERRCPKCHKVVAAYLEEEGDFLTDMRNF